jgi:hypothetical protein
MGNGATTLIQNNHLEQGEIDRAFETLKESALKDESAKDITDWRQGLHELKNIRSAIKSLDIAYNENEEKRSRKQIIGGSTHYKQFNFQETTRKRYSSRRKAERKRRKILHILSFQYFGRNMMTIKDWRECYCVCKAWRDLLSNDHLWRRRLVHLQPKPLHLSKTMCNLDEYHSYAEDNKLEVEGHYSDRYIWKPLCYRKLTCSKLALMTCDPDKDNVFDWPWDKEIMTIHAMHLVAVLTNYDPHLKCSILGKHYDTIVFGKGGYRQQTHILNISMTSGEIEFPKIKLFLDTYYNNINSENKTNWNNSINVKNIERIENCINELSIFERHNINITRDNSNYTYKFELLPMIKVLGEKTAFDKIYELVKVIDKISCAPKQTPAFQSPRTKYDDTPMVSRRSFSFELLSQIIKSFVCRNQWIKLVWFGENIALSTLFGIGHHGHHLNKESTANILKFSMMEKMHIQNYLNALPSLKYIYNSLESPQAQFVYLQNCFALLDRHGQIFLAIHVKSANVFLPRTLITTSRSKHARQKMKDEEKWALATEKTSLWNKFIQNESQSIRLSSDTRKSITSQLFHNIVMETTKYEISGISSGNRLISRKLIDSRWHDANILAFAHGNLVKNYRGETGVLKISALHLTYRIKYDKDIVVKHSTDGAKKMEEDEDAVVDVLSDALAHTNITVIDDDEQSDQFQTLMAKKILSFKMGHQDNVGGKTI